MNFNLPSTAASAFDLTDMETMAPLDFSSLRIPTREENQAMLDLISCDRTEEEWKEYLSQLSRFSFLWASDWPQPLAMEHPVWGSISLAEPERLALVKGYGNLVTVLRETRPLSFCTPIILTPPEEDAIPYQLVLSPAAALAYFGHRELLERFLPPDDPDELRAPIASMLLSPAFGGEDLLRFRRRIGALGIGPGATAAAGLLGSLCLAFPLLWIALGALTGDFPASLLPALLGAALGAGLAGACTGPGGNGTLPIFLLVLLFALCAGCLLPPAMLPGWLRALGALSPLTHLRALAAAPLGYSSPSPLPLLGMILLLWAITFLRRRKEAAV